VTKLLHFLTSADISVLSEPNCDKMNVCDQMTAY
jgi:hypothetical protein